MDLDRAVEHAEDQFGRSDLDHRDFRGGYLVAGDIHDVRSLEREQPSKFDIDSGPGQILTHRALFGK